MRRRFWPLPAGNRSGSGACCSTSLSNLASWASRAPVMITLCCGWQRGLSEEVARALAAPAANMTGDNDECREICSRLPLLPEILGKILSCRKESSLRPSHREAETPQPEVGLEAERDSVLLPCRAFCPCTISARFGNAAVACPARRSASKTRTVVLRYAVDRIMVTVGRDNNAVMAVIASLLYFPS